MPTNPAATFVLAVLIFYQEFFLKIRYQVLIKKKFYSSLSVRFLSHINIIEKYICFYHIEKEPNESWN